MFDIVWYVVIFVSKPLCDNQISLFILSSISAPHFLSASLTIDGSDGFN